MVLKSLSLKFMFLVLAIVLTFVVPTHSKEIEVEWIRRDQKALKNEYSFELFPMKMLNTLLFPEHLNPVAAVITSNEKNYIVVGWLTFEQDGERTGVFGRIVDMNNSFVTEEFQVNTIWKNAQQHSTLIPFNHGNNFVFSWTCIHEIPELDDPSDIFQQQFDSETFEKVGNEYPANNVTTVKLQMWNDAITLSDGGFLVIWDAAEGERRIAGRLYNSNGQPEGDDFNFTSGIHPHYESDVQAASFPNGDFIITFKRDVQSPPYHTLHLYRRYSRDGAPKTEEIIYSDKPRVTGPCETLEDDKFIVGTSSISAHYLYFYTSNDELYRSIGIESLSTVEALKRSPSGKILVHLNAMALFLLNSNGDLLADVFDYTEGQSGHIDAQDVVFIDEETIYVTWDIYPNYPNTDVENIYGRFIKIKSLI